VSQHSSALLPQHAALLEASAIDAGVARERGYLSAANKADLERHGFTPAQRRVPALLAPVWGVSGEVLFHQARPDEPRLNSKGKPIRYETVGGVRTAIDVHPRVRELLGDPRIPLLITEGIRKADSALSADLRTHGETGALAPVALLGVWNWRGRNEQTGLTALPDWESVALNGRLTYLGFDSDVMLKPQVDKALRRLKRFLESRGAIVRILYLEPGANGEKVGIDDYLAAGGSLQRLLERAEAQLRAPAAEPEAGSRADETSPTTGTPEPEDGAALLDDVCAFYADYVVTGEEELDEIALWTVLTHLSDLFRHTPYQNVTSAENTSGKTQFLECMELLVANPLKTDGASPAAIYRAVDRFHPTLLIDESETSMGKRANSEMAEALRGVINSGFRRGGNIVRCIGKTHEPTKLETYCPKAFAGIGDYLPATVLSRCVTLRLKRRKPSEPIKPFQDRLVRPRAEELRGRIERWAGWARGQRLEEAWPEAPRGLGDRQIDIWIPLFSIADLAGGDWPARARRAAVMLSGAQARAQADSIRVRLLSDIYSVYMCQERDGEAFPDTSLPRT
jgi:Protein of unknown function (DUF3631)/Domain of unknown function (DUF3854)